MVEVQELLRGHSERCDALGEPRPIEMIVDNCCTVDAKIKAVEPDIHVGQDIWHLYMR